MRAKDWPQPTKATSDTKTLDLAALIRITQYSHRLDTGTTEAGVFG